MAAHERRHLWYLETFVLSAPGFPRAKTTPTQD